MKSERLFQTVEEIRRSRYPGLDPALVKEILSCQVQMQEDRMEAQARTERAIAKWANAYANRAPGDE